MRLSLPSGPAHLTYCTNVHAGESWDETFAALRRFLPAVKRQVAPREPMGVGLRLSAAAARTLERPERLDAFRDFLRTEGLYVFTLNGFPYSTFHGGRVKQEVYRPDWRAPERLDYTDRLSRLLAALLSDDSDRTGSVSTVPGMFRGDVAVGDREAVADAMLRHLATLPELEGRTGRRIVLALEPEPMCLLETTAEAVGFIEDQLLGVRARERFRALSGCASGAAERLLRRYLGLCLDVCHAAMGFETAADSVATLSAAGIAVAKLQLSCALSAPRVDAGIARSLGRFDDGVYLHQVTERMPAGLIRFLDLPDAVSDLETDPGRIRDWRVHCHVPVFVESLDDGLQTTQAVLRDMLALQRTDGISPHLEVETYTWDVLPPELRREPLADAIARELRWVREELLA